MRCSSAELRGVVKLVGAVVLIAPILSIFAASPALAGTGAPPSIESESASHITPTDATLEAEINLHEAPDGVYYQFQLVRESNEFASEIVCPSTPPPGYSGCVGPQAATALPIGFLPGNTAQPSATLGASLDLASAGVTLQPGTTYHYRVLAARAVQTEDTIEWEPPTAYGSDQTFTTPIEPVSPAGGIGSGDDTVAPAWLSYALVPELVQPPLKHELRICRRQLRKERRSLPQKRSRRQHTASHSRSWRKAHRTSRRCRRIRQKMARAGRNS
jgi:hypothetical protein